MTYTDSAQHPAALLCESLSTRARRDSASIMERADAAVAALGDAISPSRTTELASLDREVPTDRPTPAAESLAEKLARGTAAAAQRRSAQAPSPDTRARGGR